MRREYPRPDFVREDWLNLNGSWEFSYGDKKTQIQVPFVCQCEKSGIGERITEDHVTYERTFRVPSEWKEREIILNFGAVDYQCQVFVNESCVGSHVGGQTSFSFNITPYLNWNEEKIRVEVYDPLYDESIARGKQFWEQESRFIWYTPSTGIWQTVWLEPVDKTRFEWIHFTPDIDEGTVKVEYQLAETSVLPAKANITICFGGKVIFDGTVRCEMLRNEITIDVFRKKAMEGAFHFVGNYWSPENPLLYDVHMEIGSDKVDTYFGMRKINVVNGRLYLNNQPYMHKLVLDQGYWKESLVTAPTDEEYKNDILKCKEMGFNGCRKHEKVEDPRFLYWADKLGFLVWEGMASFWAYTPQAASAFTREWLDVIQRDYNHPSIVVWGMLNESWGVTKIYDNKQQQAFASSLYYMAKALDTSRLVISNDGWEMRESDICAIHSYMHGEKDDVKQHQRFIEGLQSVDKFHYIMEKQPYAKGTKYEGQPVVITECGGIAVKAATDAEVSREDAIGKSDNEWGYTSTSQEDFIEEYRRVIESMYASDLVNGFCYTQLTDVEQETNGLLTKDHQFKFDPAEIKKINDRKK